MTERPPIGPIHLRLPADPSLSRVVRLAAAGLLVPAIRPPTVPQGTARLRISLSADHDADDVARLAAALVQPS